MAINQPLDNMRSEKVLGCLYKSALNGQYNMCWVLNRLHLKAKET